MMMHIPLTANKTPGNLRMQNESKRYLQLVNDIMKEFKSHITVYRDSNGLILNAPPPP
jgi:hypothetical protein